MNYTQLSSRSMPINKKISNISFNPNEEKAALDRHRTHFHAFLCIFYLFFMFVIKSIDNIVCIYYNHTRQVLPAGAPPNTAAVLSGFITPFCRVCNR